MTTAGGRRRLAASETSFTTEVELEWGGKAVKAPLDEADRRIIADIGPFLKQQGLFFVGIDVIGGLLTEINVTSPTGLQEIDRLDGSRIERAVLDRIEQRAAEQRVAS